MVKVPRTYIIAEAGVNHNGSLDIALQLIDAAVKAGADAVKFQTFRSEQLVSQHAPKADYQKRLTDQNETQYEMLKKLELDGDAHHILIEYCKKQGIAFLSTPFDLESAHLLTQQFKLKQVKISSGDITNAPLLLQLASMDVEIILSSGASLLGEVEQALSVLAFGYLHTGQTPSVEAFENAYSSIEGQTELKKHVSLLHCTSEYPTPFSEVNLKAMDTLREAFKLNVGLSDHTKGYSIAIASVACGASIIEKHFTIDRTLPGPDHQASLEPAELTAMILGIREVEEALGSGIKYPTASEAKNRQTIRKSIVASTEIRIGEAFSLENITLKRPGNGLSPFQYWECIGKPATKNYEKDEVIIL